jgi:hypothetical protein
MAYSLKEFPVNKPPTSSRKTPLQKEASLAVIARASYLFLDAFELLIKQVMLLQEIFRI